MKNTNAIKPVCSNLPTRLDPTIEPASSSTTQDRSERSGQTSVTWSCIYFQVSNRFERWKRISGIRKNITIHSFRAAYAVQLYQKSKDPLLVSYALGHSSFETTKRYINQDHLNFRSIVNDAFINGV